MAIDIQKPLKKYVPFLLQAREQSLNEADTLQRIVRVPAKDVMTTKRPAEPTSDNEPASDATLAE
jgi:hypothetical protein